MSKAFVREDDDAGDSPVIARLPTLAPGAKNFITADGARRLREQRVTLESQRAPLVGVADSETRRELQALNQRIRELEQSLRSAEVTAPPSPPWTVVRFGATVRVKDQAGSISEYRLVGMDETDPARGWVSWQSPIARALLNASVGERVTFAFPSGRAELEITGIRYE